MCRDKRYTETPRPVSETPRLLWSNYMKQSLLDLHLQIIINRVYRSVSVNYAQCCVSNCYLYFVMEGNTVTCPS